VSSSDGSKSPLFDQAKLASALSTVESNKVDSRRMVLAGLTLTSDRTSMTFQHLGQGYRFTLATGALEKADVNVPEPPARNGRRRGGGGRNGVPGGTDGFTGPKGPYVTPEGASPDESRDAQITDGQVQVRTGEGAWKTLTTEGEFTNFHWAGDSKHLLALRLLPGDHKKLFLLHTLGPDKTRATVEERFYDQPGDKMDTFEPYMLDADAGTEKKVALDPILGGSYPGPGAPGASWWDGKFIMDYPIRGNQEYKVEAIAPDGTAQALIDETSKTFIDNEKMIVRPLTKTQEIVLRSERDGWARLYLVDGATGAIKNGITPTGWVCRTVDRVDEANRQIWFSACGDIPGQDPYYIHFYRVNFDGTGLVSLTPGDGTHRVVYSPDNSMYVDTYSRVDMAPIHELRRSSDGSKVADLAKADISGLLKNGVFLPERFVAKGRDGKTDIYGVVVIPTNYDRHRSYPVIENIYAGPQDSFVPKAFAPFTNMHRLAELGFIVVQIDGMGTDNRGKAFHDVCWHNLADAGFPDRIAWMKALHEHMPQANIDDVGVYGTSAGGQNACGAVLFHPEFYKAAVASCGCHDNTIDKQWWNEQWMGYPIGPWYAEQSNMNNVSKLKGHLFLMVGEDDHNVPPETTIRLLDAFMKANKNVDFLIIPGADHTDGGPYGEHKRRDFFVRNLLGVEPPNWN
jgi:dipeptidyl aminopeptidase/acylaminoacyl peptidase